MRRRWKVVSLAVFRTVWKRKSIRTPNIVITQEKVVGERKLIEKAMSQNGRYPINAGAIFFPRMITHVVRKAGIVETSTKNNVMVKGLTLPPVQESSTLLCSVVIKLMADSRTDMMSRYIEIVIRKASPPTVIQVRRLSLRAWI